MRVVRFLKRSWWASTTSAKGDPPQTSTEGKDTRARGHPGTPAKIKAVVLYTYMHLNAISSPHNSKRQIKVGTPGPQQQAPDHSGHYRTSTASSESQWALPHMKRRKNVSSHANKDVRTQSRTYPNLFTDDASEHKPDLMPEEVSEHCINPHVRLC